MINTSTTCSIQRRQCSLPIHREHWMDDPTRSCEKKNGRGSPNEKMGQYEHFSHSRRFISHFITLCLTNSLIKRYFFSLLHSFNGSLALIQFIRDLLNRSLGTERKRKSRVCTERVARDKTEAKTVLHLNDLHRRIFDF